MAVRVGRKKNELPHLYYEGFLEKRSFKDKTSRKLWTCLCGNTLFFFNSNKDTNYIEKLDLNGFISVTDDNSCDRNIGAARLSLRLKDGEIKFTASSSEARLLWKAYIQAVVQLSVPTSLNLLPGQIHTLSEVVEKEKGRIQELSPPNEPTTYVSLKADMPACYYPVARTEAELMLERYADKGNLLLRPGSAGNSFAVTTRQDLNGPIIRHYRVNRKYDGSYAIDVDNPIPCATLLDVINFLVEKTSGVLKPLIMENAYETNIMFVKSNEENGEKSVHCAPSNPVPTSRVPPIPAPRKNIPVPEPEPEPEPEECLYLNEQELQEEVREAELSSGFDLPEANTKTSKQPLMPPARSHASHSFTASSSTTDSPREKRRALTASSVTPDHRIEVLSEELRLKFEKMGLKNQE